MLGSYLVSVTLYCGLHLVWDKTIRIGDTKYHISVQRGHNQHGPTNFLVKVELTWVQDPKSSPKSSWKLPTNTLNTIYRTQVAQKQNNHPCYFFKGKQLMWPTLIFFQEYRMGWKVLWPTLIFIESISMGSTKHHRGPTVIEMFIVPARFFRFIAPPCLLFLHG